jgi:hypothetical protein
MVGLIDGMIQEDSDDTNIKDVMPCGQAQSKIKEPL